MKKLFFLFLMLAHFCAFAASPSFQQVTNIVNAALADVSPTNGTTALQVTNISTAISAAGDSTTLASAKDAISATNAVTLASANSSLVNYSNSLQLNTNISYQARNGTNAALWFWGNTLMSRFDANGWYVVAGVTNVSGIGSQIFATNLNGVACAISNGFSTNGALRWLIDVRGTNCYISSATNAGYPSGTWLNVAAAGGPSTRPVGIAFAGTNIYDANGVLALNSPNLIVTPSTIVNLITIETSGTNSLGRKGGVFPWKDYNSAFADTSVSLFKLGAGWHTNQSSTFTNLAGTTGYKSTVPLPFGASMVGAGQGITIIGMPIGGASVVNAQDWPSLTTLGSNTISDMSILGIVTSTNFSNNTLQTTNLVFRRVTFPCMTNVDCIYYPAGLYDFQAYDCWFGSSYDVQKGAYTSRFRNNYFNVIGDPNIGDTNSAIRPWLLDGFGVTNSIISEGGNVIVARGRYLNSNVNQGCVVLNSNNCYVQLKGEWFMHDDNIPVFSCISGAFTNGTPFTGHIDGPCFIYNFDTFQFHSCVVSNGVVRTNGIP